MCVGNRMSRSAETEMEKAAMAMAHSSLPVCVCAGVQVCVRLRETL